MKERPGAPALAIPAIFGLALLGACHAGAPDAGGGAVAGGDPSEKAYRQPPELQTVAPLGQDRLELAGQAQPGSRIRLAAPQGPAVMADANAAGAWRVAMNAAAQPRLYSLAMIEGDRTTPSEGYVALIPGGEAVRLRAGAGAQVLGRPSAGIVLLAIDYDPKGGAVVSGRAAPRAVVDVLVDGARSGRVEAGAQGFFFAPLNGPLAFGPHLIQAGDGTLVAGENVVIAPAAALSGGPYRAAPVADGWRIDWTTPAGGLQTTLLLARPRRAA